jgi:hypothetical protein
MSKHIAGTALLLVLLATSAHSETPDDSDLLDVEERVVSIGDSDWELFRPESREQTYFDLAYLTDDLRSPRSRFGLRFQPSSRFTIDFEVDPLTRQRDLIGPVYDFRIGATMLALRFSF